MPKAQELLAELEDRYRDSLFASEPSPLLAAPRRPKVQARKRAKTPPLSPPPAHPPTVAHMLTGLGSTHEAIAERARLARERLATMAYRSARKRGAARLFR